MSWLSRVAFVLFVIVIFGAYGLLESHALPKSYTDWLLLPVVGALAVLLEGLFEGLVALLKSAAEWLRRTFDATAVVALVLTFMGVGVVATILRALLG